MRVIAGKYGSRRLRAPAGRQTRPTSDQLRETLFNVVAAGVAGSVWLDLFAGSGAVGIEAISRGARMAYFVEFSRRVAETIRANLAALNITQGYEIIQGDACTALRRLEGQAVVCDFCFLDPPYRKWQDYEDALNFLAQSGLLGEEGVVIAEHDKRFDPGAAFGRLRRERILRQGDSALSFYKRNNRN